MKKILLLLSAYIIVSNLSAQTPVAYYPFNGNSKDAAGTLNGTVNGATLTADRFGNANSAYNFNGASDFISFTGPATIQTDNWTITAWVKPASLNQVGTVVNNGADNGSSGDGYAMGMRDANVGSSGNAFAAIFGQVSLINSGFNFASTTTWVHLVMVRQGGTTKFYFNGVQTPLTSTSTPLTPTQFRIGSSTGIRFWNGAIDEVKIYNIALTALQIQQDYASSNQTQAPGSGNALSFDGVNNYVEIVNNAAIPSSGPVTVEAWLKYNSSSGRFNWFKKGTTNGYGLYLLNNTVFVITFDVINWNTGVVLSQNTWQHITFTYDGTTQRIYKNGILAASINAGYINASPNAYIGANFTGQESGFFMGQIEEVRIWNTALSQSQIRDRMCRKITSTDALINNMAAYYNFDEATGNTAFDGTTNANNGTLINGPTRVTSGAAIGNTSAHDYVNATKTASIAHANGESFTVTSSTGNPDAIQVYRVDVQPNTLTGTAGVGANNKYFGVFQVNGTTPTYQAVYNYNGNPFVTPANESQLRLYKRADNAVTSWSFLTAIPNEPANTITVTGESTEYILGSIGSPLPINLISFGGSKQNSDVLLQWRTANELNVSRFELQRSDDGQNFNTIGTIQAAGTVYSFTDPNIFNSKIVVFYRLKSIDADGRFSISGIVKLSRHDGILLAVFPNPVKDKINLSMPGTDEKWKTNLYTLDGRLINNFIINASQNIQIPVQYLSKGNYILELSNGVIKHIVRFVKE